MVDIIIWREWTGQDLNIPKYTAIYRINKSNWLHTDHNHPLPSISNFNIIDKDPSQVTWEAKEAIHIRRLDPNLNRNIGKMSIPHCFDPLLGIKPKHPQVNLLSQAQESVDEVAPPSQIPGLNLTQFNEIGSFRSNLLNKIPKRSNRACRAKNLLN